MYFAGGGGDDGDVVVGSAPYFEIDHRLVAVGTFEMLKESRSKPLKKRLTMMEMIQLMWESYSENAHN